MPVVPILNLNLIQNQNLNQRRKVKRSVNGKKKKGNCFFVKTEGDRRQWKRRAERETDHGTSYR